MTKNFAPGILAITLAACGPGQADSGNEGDDRLDEISDELAEECAAMCTFPLVCDAAEIPHEQIEACIVDCTETNVTEADATSEACLAAYVDGVECVGALDCDGYDSWSEQEADFACREPTILVEVECPGLVDF